MHYSNNRFRHLYVETELLSHPETERIQNLFPHAEVIPVRRYSDVFNRPKQDYRRQYEAMNLILAKKHGSLLYEGAPVCHDFGSARFYYTAMAVNCLYDCEYCWLKGMYHSANLVVFLNLEDAFAEAEEKRKEGPMYLSLSFESDLVPLEPITGQIARWNEYLLDRPDITAEIRTKCGATSLYPALTSCPNLIFAFTLSPESVIASLEHGTSSLQQRLEAAGTAMACGFPVRLCIDPMIRVPEWKQEYAGMIKTISENIDLSRVKDFSVGTYRQSDTYQRRMRRSFPASAVIQYPYVSKDGYCQYPDEERIEMEQFMKQRLLEYVREDQIYLLEDNR